MKLLDDLKERRGYSHLKEEALDRAMWRALFGRGFGPVVRQTTKWMNTQIVGCKCLSPFPVHYDSSVQHWLYTTAIKCVWQKSIRKRDTEILHTWNKARDVELLWKMFTLCVIDKKLIIYVLVSERRKRFEVLYKAHCILCHLQWEINDPISSKRIYKDYVCYTKTKIINKFKLFESTPSSLCYGISISIKRK